MQNYNKIVVWAHVLVGAEEGYDWAGRGE